MLITKYNLTNCIKIMVFTLINTHIHLLYLLLFFPVCTYFLQDVVELYKLLSKENH